MTRNNMYVFAIAPEDLLADAAVCVGLARLQWADREPPCRPRGVAAARGATIFGFALWWDCTLAPGVVLSTSPQAPRTHWDQIYLPLLATRGRASRRRAHAHARERDRRRRERHRGPLDASAKRAAGACSTSRRCRSGPVGSPSALVAPIQHVACDEISGHLVVLNGITYNSR